MRNIIVLGASALVLALGVAQASASQNNSVADHFNSVQDYQAAASAQPSYVGELRDFRAQAADPYATQYFPTLSANARSVGH
jgi:hypothetical protein